MDSHGTLKHHLKRKRAENGSSLKKTFWVGVLDVIIYPIGFASLAMALPQAYQVWILGKTDGVSLMTWASWAVFSLFWIAYASVHKARALLTMQIGWFFVHMLVAIGIFVNS